MTKIYEAHHYIVIRTNDASPSKHRHMAAHIIVALKGKLTLAMDGQVSFGSGVMIPSGVSHRIDANQNPCLVFLFDNSTNAAERINQLRILSEDACEAIADLYGRFEQEGTNAAFQQLEKRVLAMLGLSAVNVCVGDTRIREVMKRIHGSAGEKISCQDAADAVFLSQSRFSHLFHQQTGMTFAAYTVYQCMMYAYKTIWEGKSITEAAIDAGFSSSAHFADVNRRVFGLAAHTIAKEMCFQKIV